MTATRYSISNKEYTYDIMLMSKCQLESLQLRKQKKVNNNRFVQFGLNAGPMSAGIYLRFQPVLHQAPY